MSDDNEPNDNPLPIDESRVKAWIDRWERESSPRWFVIGDLYFPIADPPALQRTK